MSNGYKQTPTIRPLIAPNIILFNLDILFSSFIYNIKYDLHFLIHKIIYFNLINII